MRSLTRLTVLVVVLAGLTLATGVAYAGQLDIQQVASMFRPGQGASSETQGFMDIDLRNYNAQLKSNSSGMEDDDDIEIIGTVTSITTDTLVVDDTVIAITAETEFEDEVAVGDMVKVEAFYADDGTLTAHKVELYEDDDDGEYFNIIGTVTEITTDTLVVDDTVIAITPDTIFEDEIAVGDMVKVKAFYADDGTLTAYKVKLYEQNDDGPGYGYQVKVMVVGIVDSFTADSIVVSGIPISVTEQTKIVGDIEVGDVVRVHAFLAEDGTLTAWKIKWLPDAVANPGNGDKISVIRGVVESLSEDTLIVSGISFAITSETVFSGDISVGDTVKVHAYTTEDGVVTASRVIELRGGSDDASSRGNDASRSRPDRNNPGSDDHSQGGGRGLFKDKSDGKDKATGNDKNNGNDKAGGNNKGGGKTKDGSKDK